MDNAVLIQIEGLRRASITILRQKYEELFQEATRCPNRKYLFRRIAWRLQALAEGDLSERARTRAHQIARDIDVRIIGPRGFLSTAGERVDMTKGNRRERDRRLPPPGAVLTRKWQGRTILVTVLADGFRYDNRQYSSLSAIAVAITGTRWNGLAFFGLTRPAALKRKELTHAQK